MSYSLVLNSSNVIGASKNTYRYDFVQGSFKIDEGAEMCISSLTVPYSWYNVSTIYNNKSFQIVFPTLAGSTTLNITLPDGFYTVDDIDSYIKQQLYLNSLYLKDASGNIIYYFTMLYNVSTYKIQMLFYTVPTSLPVGYSNPAGMTFPATATAPSIVISSNNFGKIIGYSAGTYGGGVANASTLSNLVPVGSNVNSVIVRCSLVDNKVIIPTDILDSFPINSNFGSNINYSPNFQKWMKVKAGIYSSITITLSDQNLNDIAILDSNCLINLFIRQK